MPIDEWIDKIWHIHTIEYYSDFKKSYIALLKKEILSYATTWMNIEDILLSKADQSQKDYWNTICFHSHEITRVVKIMETMYYGGCWEPEEGNMGSCSMSIELWFDAMKKF